MTSRLNNPDKSAIVVVMQRLHERDVSGVILDSDMGYDHIMLPMRYDPLRSAPTLLGYEDPRTERDELLFPQRFPQAVVDRDEAAMGPYATAGQYAQSPEPRGGGIIKDSWWQVWDRPEHPLVVRVRQVGVVAVVRHRVLADDRDLVGEVLIDVEALAV